jgi:hypothetical protein
VVRIGRLLPRGACGSAHPAVVWAIALPFWMALALAAQMFAPSAAYLAIVPLLAAGVALAVLPLRRVAGLRIASAVVAIVAAVLWVGDAVLLFRFVVTAFGRMSIVTPIYVYPALLLVDPTSAAVPEDVEEVRERLGAVRIPLVGELPEEGDPRDTPLETLMVITKADRARPDDLAVLEEFYGGQYPIHNIRVRFSTFLELLGITVTPQRIYNRPTHHDATHTGIDPESTGRKRHPRVAGIPRPHCCDTCRLPNRQTKAM